MDFRNVIGVARLEHDAQVAGVHVGTLAVAFMVNGDDIGTKTDNHVTKSEQRTRTVGHFDDHLGGTSAFQQTTVDDPA